MTTGTESQPSREGDPTRSETGNGLIDRARGAAQEQLDSQKNRATDGIASVANAVRQTTQQLRDDDHDVIAHYVEQTADQLERFQQRLRDKSVTELLADVQRFARRDPTLFAAGAFAAGLLAARFLKSSGRSRDANATRSALPARLDPRPRRELSGGTGAVTDTSAPGHSVHDYQPSTQQGSARPQGERSARDPMIPGDTNVERTPGARATKARRGTQSERS